MTTRKMPFLSLCQTHGSPVTYLLGFIRLFYFIFNEPIYRSQPVKPETSQHIFLYWQYPSDLMELARNKHSLQDNFAKYKQEWVVYTMK